MLVRKSNGQETADKRNLKVLTLFNLVEDLGELKERGYFYSEEAVYSGSGTPITMSKERELLCLPQEWSAKQLEEKQITTVRLTFRHIITGEAKYLFLQEEMLEEKLETVMWLDDNPGSGWMGSGRIAMIKDMPIVFEEILYRYEMIIVPGKFYKLNLYNLKEIMGKSLFSLLYNHEFSQVQEGYVEIKEDKNSEKSFAWAGEFACGFGNWECKKYLEVAIYHREYEEWEYGCDEKLSCIWEESITDVYVAWSWEKLSESGPEDEKRIPLKALRASEEIAEYLRAYHGMDKVLNGL